MLRGRVWCSVVHNVNSNELLNMVGNAVKKVKQQIWIPSVFISEKSSKYLRAFFIYHQQGAQVASGPWQCIPSWPISSSLFYGILAMFILGMGAIVIVHCIQFQNQHWQNRLTKAATETDSYPRLYMETSMMCVPSAWTVWGWGQAEGPPLRSYHCRCVDPWLIRPRRRALFVAIPVCQNQGGGAGGKISRCKWASKGTWEASPASERTSLLGSSTVLPTNFGSLTPCLCVFLGLQQIPHTLHPPHPLPLLYQSHLILPFPFRL